MAARRQTGSPSSIAPFVLPIGVAAVPLGAWFGYPGVAGLWAALIVAAIIEPAPLLTGRRVGGRPPQPAGEREERRVAAYRFWQELRWKLIVPTLDWLPGWPVRASWIAAFGAAAVALTLPCQQPVWRLANVAAAWIVTVQTTASSRRSRHDCPGLRLNTFPLRPLPILSGLIAAGLFAVAAVLGPPILAKHYPVLDLKPIPALAAGLAILGFLAGLYPVWQKRALTVWRDLVATRSLWRPWWEALKVDPAPTLVEHRFLADLEVAVFESNTPDGSAGMRKKADAIATMVGGDGGVDVTVLTVPNEANGQPIPGTTHPRKFMVVTCPHGATFEDSPEAADLDARCDLQRSWDAMKLTTTPDLVHEVKIGDWTIRTFTAPANEGSSGMLAKAGKITTAFGAGVDATVLPEPNEVGGKPVPGTIHPMRFSVVTVPHSAIGNNLDDPAVGELAARTRVQRAWDAMKLSPPPALYSRATIDGTVVQTFVAPDSEGSTGMLSKAPKIASALGAGTTVSVIPVPDDVDGIPLPGTIHQRRFAIVTAKHGHRIDVGDPATSPQAVQLAAQCALTAACNQLGYFPMVVTKVTALHTDDSTGAAWQVDGLGPGGPAWSVAREGGMSGILAETLDVAAVIDHRGTDGGRFYIGNFESTAWQDENTGKAVQNLFTEDRWSFVWGQVLKQGAQAPVIQHKLGVTATYQGQQIDRVVFQVRQGLNSMEHGTKDTEKKLGNTLEASPFVSVVGFPGGASRPGTRHPTAFALHYSARTGLPSGPHHLIAERTPAVGWLLAAYANAMFDAARLPRPEVATFRCLTNPEPRPTFSGGRPGSIWSIDVRLYDGVTLSDVRGAAERMRQALAIPWLRVDKADDGCVIYAGVTPRDAVGVSDRDREKLTALDWDAAFLAGKLSGQGGLLPVLTSAIPVAANPDVTTLTFTLPPGMSIPDIAKALPKLKTATGNDFIEIDRTASSAAVLVILTAEHDPMPKKVGLDVSTIKPGDTKVPLGATVTGVIEPWDALESPHLGVIGKSGSGKSATMASLITGLSCAGFDIIVIDPIKDAADFKFAENWMLAIAIDWQESAALAQWVYKEVKRRKKLNGQYGARSINELPADVRPRRWVLIIDEFTSLIEKEVVSKTPSMDLDMEADRQRSLAENFAKDVIGSMAGKISREARSSGIHLLLSGQKFRQDDLLKLPGGASIKTNLARLLQGQTSPGDRASGLTRAEEAPVFEGDVPVGRAIFEPSTGSPHTIQICYNDPDDLIGMITAVRGSDPVDGKIDPASLLPPGSGSQLVEDIPADDLWPFDDDDVDASNGGELDLSMFEDDDAPETPQNDEPDDEPPMPVQDAVAPVTEPEQAVVDPYSSIWDDLEIDEPEIVPETPSESGWSTGSLDDMLAKARAIDADW
jgi:S-DNA-T family DNA segregation ATPase FtsK/SpoIIIE